MCEASNSANGSHYSTVVEVTVTTEEEISCEACDRGRKQTRKFAMALPSRVLDGDLSALSQPLANHSGLSIVLLRADPPPPRYIREDFIPPYEPNIREQTALFANHSTLTGVMGETCAGTKPVSCSQSRLCNSGSMCQSHR
jgi:hypothetical protein